MNEDAAGRGIRIAVIDSGVHPGHDHIDAAGLIPGIALRADGTLDQSADATLDRLGHGTAVTAAIQEKAPGALCMPVRVFHDSLKTTGFALVTAIDWAVANGADIINLSLGSTNPSHAAAFGTALKLCLTSGGIVVAPREANGATCYPGALDGALGVDVEWDCPRDRFACATDGSGAFVASGFPRPIDGIPPQRNLYGISFATAQISGFAARELEHCPGRDAGPSRLDRLREAMIQSAGN